MGPAWGQVEHVSRFEQPLLSGLELSKNFERRPWLQSVVTRRGDPPAAPSPELDEENIVGVEVGADPALIRGEADHQIVESGIGDEPELGHQFVGAVIVQIDALHQQGPATSPERRHLIGFERPVRELPAAAE